MTEVLSQRAAVHMHARAGQGPGVTVLAVDRMLFDPVVEQLKLILGDKKASEIAEPEFARPLQERAEELCREPNIDLSPLIIFVVFGLPLLGIYAATGLTWQAVSGLIKWEKPRYERAGPPLLGYEIDKTRD